MNINELKKKIIYRSNYRGNKELDILLSSFVKKIINSLNEKELVLLENLINLDDEILFKLNKGDKVQINCDNNKIIDMFKIFKI